MEANSHSECLEDQIREYYGRVAWTHKTHEKQADIYSCRDSLFKWLQIVLTAVTTSGVIASIFGAQQWVPIVTGIISTLLLTFTSYLKNNDLGEKAQLHASIAIQVWDVRERLLSLITDMKAGIITNSDVTGARDSIHRDLLQVYEKAPRTSNKAYSLASKALKQMEELTFSDEEIDKLLPKILRKNPS